MFESNTVPCPRPARPVAPSPTPVLLNQSLHGIAQVPLLDERRDYNTTSDVLALVSDARYARFFGAQAKLLHAEPFLIALCFKNSPPPCGSGAQSAAWRSLVDELFAQVKPSHVPGPWPAAGTTRTASADSSSSHRRGRSHVGSDGCVPPTSRTPLWCRVAQLQLQAQATVARLDLHLSFVLDGDAAGAPICGCLKDRWRPVRLPPARTLRAPSPATRSAAQPPSCARAHALPRAAVPWVCCLRAARCMCLSLHVAVGLFKG